MTDEVRELAAFLQKEEARTPVVLEMCVVDTVDGGGLLHVFLSGMTEESVANVRYLDSYTPTAGDTVWLLKSGIDRFVIGALA